MQGHGWEHAGVAARKIGVEPCMSPPQARGLLAGGLACQTVGVGPGLRYAETHLKLLLKVLLSLEPQSAQVQPVACECEHTYW